MKNILLIVSVCLLYSIILFDKTAAQTYFKVKDGSFIYTKTGVAKNNSTLSVDTLNEIRNISFMDTVSIFLNTSKGKNLAVEYKYAKQLSIPGQNNVGRTVGYGALIGLGIFGAMGIPAGGIGILVGGTGGALMGALIGLIIGGVGNEPDILDFSIPLTNTEKRNMTIKFLKRIKL